MREARRETKAITCKIACLEGRLGMTDIIVAPPYRPLAPVSANTPPLTASSQPAAGAAQSIRRISITDILNPAQPDQQTSTGTAAINTLPTTASSQSAADAAQNTRKVSNLHTVLHPPKVNQQMPAESSSRTKEEPRSDTPFG